jgi:hypothetical protein
MHRQTHARISLVSTLPVLCALCVIAAPATASSPDTEARPGRQVSETVDPESVEPALAAGENIGVLGDSESGEGTSSDSRPPTRALSAALAKALDRSTDGLRVFELANGGHGIDLEGRYQHALVVRMRADGTFETICVNHVREAEALLKRGSGKSNAQPLDK